MKACQTFVGWEVLMRSGRARITAQSGERRKGLTLFSVGAREFSFSRKRRCRCCGTRHSVAPVLRACGWLQMLAQCKRQTATMRVRIYLRVRLYCIVHTRWQRAAIVPPAVYLHLTQAAAWCEIWFICSSLCPVQGRQRCLLTSPQLFIIC